MKTLLRPVVFVTLLFTYMSVGAREVSIIPTPKSAVFEDNCLVIDSSVKISIGDDSLNPIVDYLSSYIATHKEDTSGNIKLNIDGDLAVEEYQLKVDSLGVSIKGGSYGGVFNGVTTLLQLLPAEVYSKQGLTNIELPYCAIEDTPRFSHRGFMIDVSRTWIEKEAIMEYIDLLAYHKINSLRLHLTDDEAWRLEN